MGIPQINVDTDLKINENTPAHQNIAYEIKLLYLVILAERTKKMLEDHAEISQRQEKVRFINNLMIELNDLRDPATDSQKKILDISQTTAELQEKFRAAREMGVKIPESKLKFDAAECDHLMTNLKRTLDDWKDTNNEGMHKLGKYQQEIDQLMLMLKEAEKTENQSKRSAIQEIKK